MARCTGTPAGTCGPRPMVGFVGLALILAFATPAPAVPVAGPDAMVPQGPPPPDATVPRWLQERAREPAPGAPVIATRGRPDAERFEGLPGLLARGDHEALLARARTVLGERPRSGLAHEVLGTAHFLAGRLDAAAEALRRATELAPEQPGPWSKLGILQLARGEPEDAERSLQRAVALDPADRFAHQRLGMLYEEGGDLDQAIHHYRRGLEGTGPEYLGVAVNLADLLNRTGRPQEAIEVLTPRAPLETALLDAHLVLGAAYLAAGQPTRADLRFGRARALAPDEPRALLGQGMAALQGGAPAAALEHLDRLVEAAPDSALAHQKRGESLLALNQPEEAADAFGRAVALGADRLAMDKRLARYYLDTGNQDAARALYADLAADGVADAEVHARLSELQLAAGDPEQALRTLRSGLEAIPDNAYLHFRLGSLLAALQRYEDGREQLEIAARLAPEDPLVLRTLSLARGRTGDRAGAVEAAERLHRLRPDLPAASLLYAMQLTAAERLGEAEGVYRAIVRRAPENAVALNNLADLLVRTGRPGDAVDPARRAAALEPENGRILDTLGWALHRHGRHAEARETLDRAAALAPERPVIQYHRGQVLAVLGESQAARAALDAALAAAPEADWAEEARRTLNELP